MKTCLTKISANVGNLESESRWYEDFLGSERDGSSLKELDFADCVKSSKLVNQPPP